MKDHGKHLLLISVIIVGLIFIIFALKSASTGKAVFFEELPQASVQQFSLAKDFEVAPTKLDLLKINEKNSKVPEGYLPFLGEVDNIEDLNIPKEALLVNDYGLFIEKSAYYKSLPEEMEFEIMQKDENFDIISKEKVVINPRLLSIQNDQEFVQKIKTEQVDGFEELLPDLKIIEQPLVNDVNSFENIEQPSFEEKQKNTIFEVEASMDDSSNRGVPFTIQGDIKNVYFKTPLSFSSLYKSYNSYLKDKGKDFASSYNKQDIEISLNEIVSNQLYERKSIVVSWNYKLNIGDSVVVFDNEDIYKFETYDKDSFKYEEKTSDDSYDSNKKYVVQLEMNSYFNENEAILVIETSVGKYEIIIPSSNLFKKWSYIYIDKNKNVYEKWDNSNNPLLQKNLILESKNADFFSENKMLKQFGVDQKPKIPELANIKVFPDGTQSCAPNDKINFVYLFMYNKKYGEHYKEQDYWNLHIFMNSIKNMEPYKSNLKDINFYYIPLVGAFEDDYKDLTSKYPYSAKVISVKNAMVNKYLGSRCNRKNYYFLSNIQTKGKDFTYTKQEKIDELLGKNSGSAGGFAFFKSDLTFVDGSRPNIDYDRISSLNNFKETLYKMDLFNEILENFNIKNYQEINLLKLFYINLGDDPFLLDNAIRFDALGGVVNHEIGHMIGGLGENYYKKDGYYTNKLNCVNKVSKYALWRDLFGSGSGVIKSEPYYACENSLDSLRPEFAGLMNNKLTPGFGDITLRFVCRELRKELGHIGGVCDNLCIDYCENDEMCIGGKCTKMNCKFDKVYYDESFYNPTTQCNSGEKCYRGVCNACEKDKHCSIVQECINNKCQAKECNLANDCSEGLACVEGKCDIYCKSTTQCRDSETCVGGLCMWKGTCKSEGDCPAGLTCTGKKVAPDGREYNVCIGCENNIECGPKSICKEDPKWEKDFGKVKTCQPLEDNECSSSNMCPENKKCIANNGNELTIAGEERGKCVLKNLPMIANNEIPFMDTGDVIFGNNMVTFESDDGSCSDSDANNIRNKGIVKYKESNTDIEKTYTDSCIDKTLVKEGTCVGTKFVESKEFCSGDEECVDGACVKKDRICYDIGGTDPKLYGGAQIYTMQNGQYILSKEYNDECRSINYVTEYTCDGKNLVDKKVMCPSMNYCSNGKCVPGGLSLCFEINKNDPNLKGRVEVYSYNYYNDNKYTLSTSREDECGPNNNLWKFRCSNQGTIVSDLVNCPQGTTCNNGLCS